MLATDHHRAVEARFIQLVEDAELARPDRVEYKPDAVVFYWDEPRTAVVVDLDEPPPGT